MNSIIFSRSRTRLTRVNYLRACKKNAVLFGVFALFVAVLSGVYLLGVSIGHKTIWANWRADIAEQKERLHIVKKHSQAQINALTTKAGLLQAHVNRLDALGNMLVKMANLDAKEFIFDSTPGVGGPHLPTQDNARADLDINAVLDRLNDALEEREHQLQVLNDLLIDQKFGQETYPQGRPVAHGWISSYFGKRTSPFTGKLEVHQGVDFAGKSGSDIIAVADGIVLQANKNGSYGYFIEIVHGNGYSTRYGHNKTLLVQVGEVIRRGQVIAKLGSTGRSTGPHVHFEVLKDRVRIDPMKFVQ